MKLYLHIGQQKTGSTSLQRFLKRNHLPLLDQKIIYPKALGANKQKLITQIINANVNEVLEKEKELKIEASETGSQTMIFSEENLFNLPIEKLERLSEFIATIFNEVVIVCYLRVQYDHVVSSYQQSIRGKEFIDLDDYITNKLNDNYYKYNQVISKWAKVFPSAQFNIRSYRRMEQNDIRLDFCKTIGVSNTNFDFNEDKLDKNMSIDAASLALIKRLNYIEHKHELSLPHDIKRSLRVGLKSSSSNQKLILTNNQKYKIYSHFLERNKQLEKSYFKTSSDFTEAPTKEAETNESKIEPIESSIEKMLTVLGYIN